MLIHKQVAAQHRQAEEKQQVRKSPGEEGTMRVGHALAGTADRAARPNGDCPAGNLGTWLISGLSASTVLRRTQP